jgi:hypothetical protein
VVASETSIFIRLISNFFTSTIRCLLFCDLTDIFSLNLQIVFISPHHSLLTFFLKNNPKNRELTIYLLVPPTYELGTFWEKIAIIRKINIMGVVFKLPRVSI